jgi:hypothetical protein
MALPEATIKMLEEGERIQKERYGKGNNEDEGTLEIVPTPEPEVTPEPTDDLGTPPVEVKKEDPDPEKLEEVAPVVAVEAVKSEEDETWKQKYDVLNGKYLAEVPRLTSEIKFLQGELDESRAKLLTLEKAEPVVPVVADPKTESPNLLAAEAKLAEELGMDVARSIMDIMAGNKTVAPAPVDLTEIKGRLARVEEGTSRSADATFRHELKGLVPSYEVLNRDQEFIGWLKNFDAVAGRTYQDALNEAHATGDVMRAAAIFNLYKPPTNKVVPVEKKETPNVAPPKGTGGGQILKNEAPKIYTTTEVERFYSDVTKGLYKSRPKQQAKMEAEINKAAVERRIRP